MKTTRILQCVDNMNRAGIETMLMNFYRNIDRNKIQFDFLINKKNIGSYENEIRSFGGKIYTAPSISIFNWFNYQKYMKKLFKENDYKIIHGQNETLCFPALYAAKKAGVPVRIAHGHNTKITIDLNYLVKYFYKHNLKKVANNLVACSNKAGEYFFKNNFKVINNAVDKEKFIYDKNTRNKIRKELNIENKFVIGHVGRFDVQKNHKFIIDLFNEYLKINDNSILLLIGEGNLKKYIMKKAKKLGILDKIIFTGSIPNVNEMYQIMDVFILPSFHEGLPVVGVEAQFSDLPCLFSDTITKELEFNRNVSFLKLNDSKNWINKIDYYCKNKINRKKVNNEVYDIKNQAKKLTDYYFSLINK